MAMLDDDSHYGGSQLSPLKHRKVNRILLCIGNNCLNSSINSDFDNNTDNNTVMEQWWLYTRKIDDVIVVHTLDNNNKTDSKKKKNTG